MIGFLVRRIAVLIPTFIGVSIIAFLFIRLLPGDPVALLSGERVMSPERHAQISAALGLDRPLVIQYFDYLKGILTGDFGTSIVSSRRSSISSSHSSRQRSNSPSAPSSWPSALAFRQV